MALQKGDYMKYCSVDELKQFRFHDAEFTFLSLENGCLTVNAKHLNISKNAEQNPYDCDMEIDHATLKFHNFYIESFHRIMPMQKAGDGNDYYFSVALHGDQAKELLIEQLMKRTTVLDFDFNDKSYYMDAISSAEPFFTTFFGFDRVVIEWDSYLQPAWYEKNS